MWTSTAIATSLGSIIIALIKDTAENRKIVCCFACICLIMQSGFREYLLPINDTLSYYKNYCYIQDLTLNQITSLKHFELGFFDNRSPVYNIFAKACSSLGINFRIYLILISSIISTCFCNYIYRNSRNIVAIIICIVLYEAIFSGFTESAIRQTLALSMALYSIKYLEQDRIPTYIAIILITVFIHVSAAILLLIHLMILYIKQQIVLMSSLISTPFLLITTPSILGPMLAKSSISIYAIQTNGVTGAPIYSLALYTIGAVTYILLRKKRDYSQQTRILISSLSCAIILLPTIWVNPTFIRLGFYFVLILIPLIPYCIRIYTNNNHLRYNKISIIMMMLLLILKMQQ